MTYTPYRIYGDEYSEAHEYQAKGRIAQLVCGCVVCFVDGVPRRIKAFAGIDVYEVDVLIPGHKLPDPTCALAKNRPDGCYYLQYSLMCKVPDDPLTAELAKLSAK